VVVEHFESVGWAPFDYVVLVHYVQLLLVVVSIHAVGKDLLRRCDLAFYVDSQRIGGRTMARVREKLRDRGRRERKAEGRSRGRRSGSSGRGRRSDRRSGSGGRSGCWSSRRCPKVIIESG